MDFRVRLKMLLWKSNFFLRIRYSSFFLKLWLEFRKDVKTELEEQEKYYNYFLQYSKTTSGIVFDIGANEGFMSALFLRKGCTVIAVEPDKRNVAILRNRFVKNKKFHLYPFVLAEDISPKKLFVQENGTALSTVSKKWKGLVETDGYRVHSFYDKDSITVESITLDQLLQQWKKVSLIKMDVEGYEANALRGLSMKVPLLIFEANLPEFLDETLDCIRQLHAIDETILFNYSDNFKLQLGKFLGYDDFRYKLPGIASRCIDVICVMSNYDEFFDSKMINR